MSGSWSLRSSKSAIGEFLVLLWLAGGAASAHCPMGSRWAGPVVDVVLQHEVRKRLCTDDAVPCNTLSQAALESTIKATLDEFYDSSGANIRLRYAGLCYMDPGNSSLKRLCKNDDLPEGQLVIRARACTANGFGGNGDRNADGFADEGFAEICTGSPDSPYVFASYPAGQAGVSLSVQGILLHELSHAIGFGHPGTADCPESGGNSVLNGSDRASLGWYDIHSLQELYGLRPEQSMEVAWSSPFDPTTWSRGSGLKDGIEALSRFSACDNLISGGTHLAYVGQAPRLVKLLTHWQDGTTSRAVGPGTFPDHVVLSSSHPGVACQDFDRLRVFYAQDDGPWQQTFRYVESTDAGQSWEPVIEADPAVTGFHGGVDAAFDPATGLYVYAYRSDGSRVFTKVVSEGSAPRGYEKSPSPGPLPGEVSCFSAGADCWRASDTPSVACGDPATLGEYNCLMAWPDVDWFRQLKYAAAKVVAVRGGHELVLHSVRDGYRTVFGTPSVALDGANDLPWRIAYHQGERRVFTLRKASDPSALLEDGGSFTFAGAIVSPSVGSLRGIELGFPRTMLFVTSVP